MDYEARKQYANYIHGQTFQYFFTGTFKSEPTTSGALRLTRKFFYNAGYDFRKGFIVAERGEQTGRSHVHGLLDFTIHNDEAVKSLWGQWFKRFGRNSFEEIHGKGKVSWYVSKYINKDCDCDSYDLIINPKMIKLYGVN